MGRGLWMRCCVGDGGGPSGIALQGEISNHRELLRLRAVGGERRGKGARDGVRCGPRRRTRVNH